MNYVDWVETVARAHARLADGHERSIGLRDVRAELGLGSQADDAIWAALKDLDALGVVALDGPAWLKATHNTQAVRSGSSLHGTWASITGQHLDDDQAAFMATLVAIALREGTGFADVALTRVEDIYANLGWDTADHEPDALTGSLENMGLIRRVTRAGDFIVVSPTYRGVVRMTRKIATDWRTRLDAMVEEWETVTVDFKPQLSLGSEKMKARFARDVIALATTKASGRDRHMILGFDDTTREFTTPLDPAISQERLEEILSAHASPAPAIRLVTLDHSSGRGLVGVLVISRDPAKLVYRIAKGSGKVQAGETFVRHGSHVVQPDVKELADLEAEGERARGAP